MYGQTERTAGRFSCSTIRANFPHSGVAIAATRVEAPLAAAFPILEALAGGAAEEAKPVRFAQFKVHMTNYEVSAGQSGCVSFSVVTHPNDLPKLPLKEVDVTLRDLEVLQKIESPVERYNAESDTWKFTLR